MFHYRVHSTSVCQQSSFSREMGNADKRSFSAGSRASSLSKQLRLTEQTKAPPHQQSGNCMKNVAAVSMSSKGQNCPYPAAVTTARGCCRTEEKIHNLFCGTPLTSQQLQEQEHHTSSRSFLFKFEAHPSNAGISMLIKNQGLELNLTTQQFYKCLGCMEEESGVLTRPHEQSKLQPLGNAVYFKNKFLTSLFLNYWSNHWTKAKATKAFPLTCRNAIIH